MEFKIEKNLNLNKSELDLTNDQSWDLNNNLRLKLII